MKFSLPFPTTHPCSSGTKLVRRSELTFMTPVVLGTRTVGLIATRAHPFLFRLLLPVRAFYYHCRIVYRRLPTLSWAQLLPKLVEACRIYYCADLTWWVHKFLLVEMTVACCGAWVAVQRPRDSFQITRLYTNGSGPPRPM